MLRVRPNLMSTFGSVPFTGVKGARHMKKKRRTSRIHVEELEESLAENGPKGAHLARCNATVFDHSTLRVVARGHALRCWPCVCTELLFRFGLRAEKFTADSSEESDISLSSDSEPDDSELSEMTLSLDDVCPTLEQSVRARRRALADVVGLLKKQEPPPAPIVREVDGQMKNGPGNKTRLAKSVVRCCLRLFNNTTQ